MAGMLRPGRRAIRNARLKAQKLAGILMQHWMMSIQHCGMHQNTHWATPQPFFTVAIRKMAGVHNWSFILWKVMPSTGKQARLCYVAIKIVCTAAVQDPLVIIAPDQRSYQQEFPHPNDADRMLNYYNNLHYRGRYHRYMERQRWRRGWNITMPAAALYAGMKCRICHRCIYIQQQRHVQQYLLECQYE